jgi:hypothetical protein
MGKYKTGNDSLDKAWDTVDDAKDRNTSDRFDWKLILGMSVTSYVEKYIDMDVYDIYEQILKEHPDLSLEQKRRLKINVSASYTYKKPHRGKIVKGD